MKELSINSYSHLCNWTPINCSLHPLNQGLSHRSLTWNRKRENRLTLMRCVQTDCQLMGHSAGHFRGLNRVLRCRWWKSALWTFDPAHLNCEGGHIWMCVCVCGWFSITHWHDLSVQSRSRCLDKGNGVWVNTYGPFFCWIKSILNLAVSIQITMNLLDEPLTIY